MPPPTLRPHRQRAARLAALSAFVAVAAGGGSALAQQAIISLPSADLTPPGETFLMHEAQVRPWSPAPYYNSTSFYAFGLDATTELAITLFDVGVPQKQAPTVANGFKSVFPVLRDSAREAELHLTVGAMALFSTSSPGAGAWAYGHLTAKAPWLEARVGAGVSAATEELYGVNATSFIASFEQPLGDTHASLVAEWFSGRHALGNFSWGVAYHPSHSLIFVLGHKIPTNGPRFGENKAALIGEIGVFF